MKFTRDLCGSRLEILIHSEGEFSDLVQECFRITESFEQKYSRFIEGNYLSQLNKTKQSELDSELQSILQLCVKVSDITNGYFDITIQSILENYGYGIEKNKLIESIGYKNIILDQNSIKLLNGVSIDLGSVGKGYIIDKIYTVLHKKIHSFSINFGGDIRVKGQQNIKLEDPMDDKKIIGSINIENQSVASSSGNKRVFGEHHHLIDAKTKNSQDDTLAVYVIHDLAIFADIFATALYVTPLQESLDILSSIPGLEAMIIDKTGEIYKSRGFKYKK